MYFNAHFSITLLLPSVAGLWRRSSIHHLGLCSQLDHKRKKYLYILCAFHYNIFQLCYFTAVACVQFCIILQFPLSAFVFHFWCNKVWQKNYYNLKYIFFYYFLFILKVKYIYTLILLLFISAHEYLMRFGYAFFFSFFRFFLYFAWWTFKRIK